MSKIFLRQAGLGSKMNLPFPSWVLVLLIVAAACAPRNEPESGLGTSARMATAPTAEGDASDSLAPDRLIAEGLDVYRRQYCGVCHILGTAESLGTSGPTHNAIGTIAAQRVRDEMYTGEAMTAEAYLRESIVAPATYLVPGYEHTRYRMPAYINLSEPELEALVQMLLRED
jgi:mono/diheme cytochrome c family protein